MIHWLNTEFWGPVWPNLVASAICSGAVYVRLRVEQARRHEDMKRHVTDSVAANSEREAK